MSEPITIYDTATGEIIETAFPNMPLDELRLHEGQAWIPGHHDGEIYWINPETGRPNKRRDAAIRIEGNRVIGIPEHAVVMVRGTVVEPVDGAVTIGVDLPENVPVRIRGPRMLKWHREVSCEPGADAPTIMLAQDYAKVRRQAYEAAGITDRVLLIAQVEAAAGDPSELEALIARRREIKARIPKKKG